MLNFKEIEKRIIELKGLAGGKDVAALFGLKPQNYSNKKGIGTLLPTIVEWAIQENVNLDWLLLGKGEIKNTLPILSADKGESFRPEPGSMSLLPFLGLPLAIDEPDLSIHPKNTDMVRKLFNDMSPLEKKIKRLSAKLERIIQEGDERKIKLLEAQLDMLDPGIKNQNVVNEQNG